MERNIAIQANIAVVGVGYWGKNLVRNFHGLGVLAAVCDSQDISGVMAEYPDVPIVTAFQDILDNPDIHAVVISTPAVTHGRMVKQALLAGKDVLVEKPMCLNSTEAEALTQLANTQKRILMVGHLLWYHPAVLMLKALLEKGILGRLQYIYSNRLNLGKLRREENVLWSFAPHDISVILGLTGEMPESIQAHGSNDLHQQIADTSVTLLTFSSGVSAHIFVSWLHPFKEQKLVVVGDKAMVVFDDTLPWSDKLTIYHHEIAWNGTLPVAHKADGQAVPLKEKEPLREECRHFLTAIHTRTPPRTDAEEGQRVLAILNHCQHSMVSGQPVYMDQHHPQTVQQPEPTYKVHDTACVDSGVVIGSGSQVWHFSHLLSGVEIGKQCSIGQNVVIGPQVTIGDGCKVQNNVSIYEGVTLEAEVFCGPSMVFTNVINPRSAIPRKDQFKPTMVRRGTTIGANATILCGIELGQYCFIGAGAVVTADVAAFALVMGNPARQTGWMSAYGHRLDLPVFGQGEAICPESGQKYQLNGQILTRAC
ncbi:MAG: Gfo/Idh/MocA family oxidoreductase [Magnetococcales bacterium]|nr:Gfo/Idh/MocA family oxidoreductase [Magnetococcales bacterium]